MTLDDFLRHPDFSADLAADLVEEERLWDELRRLRHRFPYPTKGYGVNVGSLLAVLRRRGHHALTWFNP